MIKAEVSGMLHADDLVMVINTGSGLKDVKAAMQAVAAAPIIEPTLDAVKRVIK
jgi:threonine synthase